MIFSNLPHPLPDKEDRLILFGSVPPVVGTKALEKESMPDLQNRKLDFLFELDGVGISQLRYPITVLSEIEPKLQT